MSDQSEVAEEGKFAAPVVVSRQVQHPVKDVWNVLLTDDGTEALLGPGGRLGDKGHTWQADDGTNGVTRSFHPGQQIRFSWHKGADTAPTLVDLHLRSAGDAATELEIVHDHLPKEADREWLTDHWTQALERIDRDAL